MNQCDYLARDAILCRLKGLSNSRQSGCTNISSSRLNSFLRLIEWSRKIPKRPASLRYCRCCAQDEFLARQPQDWSRALEAACRGFSQKQEETRQLEFNSATQALIDHHALEAQEVAAAAKEFAADVAKARASGAKLAEATKRHDRTGTQLEARKVRPGLPASSIIRNTIGDVPRGDGVTEYGRPNRHHA